MTDIDLDELRSELEDFTAAKPSSAHSAREERIIAGFEEIERFVAEHGRLPQHSEKGDIFERLYAVRLDRLRESEECRAILTPLDTHGLLNRDNHREPEDLSDEALLAELGVTAESTSDITRLTHVRSRQEIRAAEEIAQRTACRDFADFKPIFEQVQRELATGERQTVKYQDNAEVKQGDLFILDGQKVLVADLGEPFVGEHGRPDRRLRVIYDNATESDLLLRSLQRALNKDKVSRRITISDFGPLFAYATAEEATPTEASKNISDNSPRALYSDTTDDLPTGYIYVLRSQSDHPLIAANRSVIHKIGVTGGDVHSRIANAKKDPTYLLADVEVVATFKLANINRQRLEALLQQFFGSARLDLELTDRFGAPVKPREWFLVPLTAIEEVIEKIQDGTVDQFRYDPTAARLMRG